MAITNSYANAFAYLEQYWDQALKIGTNGAITTNQTGVLSEYGEFFPTEPGPVAVVTMPDIDTGQRGTGVVSVIKLQLDVNHDGVMDLTLGGPDNTWGSYYTGVRAFQFWVNKDHDFSSGTGDGWVGHDVLVGPNAPWNGFVDHSVVDYQGRYIECHRDLED